MRIAFGLMLAMAAPCAPAQTAVEAAAANVQLAMTLCLRNYRTPDSMLPAFAAAGFAYQPEDWGGGEIHHWYHAPANTVNVRVEAAEGASFCAISTGHLGVSQMLVFAGQVLDLLSPGSFSPGSAENESITPGHPLATQRACSGYWGLLPRRGVWVQVGNAGQDPRCIDDGTSQVMMAM